MSEALKTYELDFIREPDAPVEQATVLAPDGLEAAVNFARSRPGVRVIASRLWNSSI